MSKLPWRDPPVRAPSEWSMDFVTDLSEAVYRIRLGGEKESEAMIRADKDGGQKLRNRARSYDVMTRAYLTVLRQRALLRRVEDALPARVEDAAPAR